VGCLANPFDCITEFIFAETMLEPADVILVPGGSHPQLMEKAAALYYLKMAPYILPSGGANPHLKTTEWEFLRDVGLSLGIPEAAILKEDQAQNTFDNARNSWRVLQNEGIPVKKAILACKAAHARRALLTYQTVFPQGTLFHLAPVTDNTGITRDNWFLEEEKIKRVLIEVEKIGKYFGRHIPAWTKNSG
jgi:uncharacterized SAM-binding protein YcdF (DUF218 family)